MHKRWSRYLCCLVVSLGLLSAPMARAEKILNHIGVFEKWAKIEIVLTGPDSQGQDSASNPFAIVADVSFTGPDGQHYLVPAFYDGDGGGGLDGKVWKVRFAADQTGEWTFVSTSGNELLTGYRGSFTVTSPSPCAPAFYRWGRLEYVGTAANQIRYLKFRDGPYWLKAGNDDPENMLGGFSNYDTQAKRQAAISYLVGKGINSQYLISNNLGGDNRDVWPWLGDTEATAQANAGANARFDLARLHEWQQLFEFMMGQGVAVYLVLEDDSAWTGYDHARYFREMVARFGHLPALLFNLGEEYSEANTIDDGLDYAQLLKAIDPYDHPLGIHDYNLPTAKYLGASQLDLASIQTKETDPTLHNAKAIQWINAAIAAGQRVPMVGFDEPRPLLDRIGWWSGYLGGGVWEAHLDEPYDRPLETWESAWVQLGGARAFMEELPFWEMAPANSLVVAGVGFCLAKPGEVYAVYLPAGGSVSVELVAGLSYLYQWWDPANGVDGSFQAAGTVAGGRQSFTAPGSGDWALRIMAETATLNQPAQVFGGRQVLAPGGTITGSLDYNDNDGPGPYGFTITEGPLRGLLQLDGGVWIYTAAPGESAVDRFKWVVNDGLAVSNEAEVSITIIAGNQPPEALDQAVAMPLDSWLTIDLSFADPDNGPGPYSFELVEPPVNGRLLADGCGCNSYRYQPAAGFSGSDSFTFTVHDGLDPSPLGRVDIQVLGSDNNPPLIVSLPNEDAEIGIPYAYQVVAEDQDLGDALLFSLESGPAGMTMEPVTGLISWLPVPGQEGSQPVTLRVVDANGLFDLQNYSITVAMAAGENVPPLVQDQALSTPFATGLEIVLDYSDSDGPGPYRFWVLSAPAHGSLGSDDGDSLLSYQPAADFSGSDFFTFMVNDGLADSLAGRVEIMVGAPADKPPVNTEGLITLYHFNQGADESAQLVADFSGAGQEATCDPALGACPTWSPAGKYGGAYSYDGLDDHFSVPDGPLWDLADFTIAAWINVTSYTGEDMHIWGHRGLAPVERALWLYVHAVDGANYLSFRRNNVTLLSAPVELPAGVWQHVAVTYRALTGEAVLYLNGLASDTAVQTGALFATDNVVDLGWRTAKTDNAFHGLIDELAVWQKTLLAAEVEELFRAEAEIELRECAEGETSSCYSGPAGTEEIGSCRAGLATCVDGQWGLCEGETIPASESCADGLDNDCNGLVDELELCCDPAETRPCGTEVGACELGLETCGAEGRWDGGCVGGISAVAEVCDDLIDNNCDGQVDECVSSYYFPPPGQGLENQDQRLPEELGLDPEIINDLSGQATEWALWRHGFLVQVQGNFNANSEMQSLRKTVHALTVGAAIGQGRISSLAQEIRLWQPELTGNDAAATWWHLITQSAGLDYPGCGDLTDYYPGEIWTYSDLNLIQLCNAVAKAYGKADYYDNYTEVVGEALFNAIGMEGWSLSPFDDGIRFAFDLEDLGRLGLLLVADGNWGSNSIVPAWFIEELESKQTYGMAANYQGCNDGYISLAPAAFPEAPYGYLTWVNSDGDYYPDADRNWAWALGYGGQLIMWNRTNGIVFAAKNASEGALLFQPPPLSGVINGIPYLIEKNIVSPNPLIGQAGD